MRLDEMRFSEVRDIVKEIVGARVSDAPFSSSGPVSVTHVVSPEDVDAPVDPPVDDPNYSPANSRELAAAAAVASKSVPPDAIEEFYRKFARLVAAAEAGEMSPKPKKEKRQKPDESAASRRSRRLAMLEQGGSPMLAFSGWGEHLTDDDEDEEEPGEEKRLPVHDEERVEKKKHRKHMHVGDVEGAQLEDIAKEFGFAAPIGAKGFIDRTLEKFGYLWDLREQDPITFDRMLFLAADEYIEYLQGSDELSDEDVALLRSNPEHVLELDGFREFMHKHIKRAMLRQKKGRATQGEASARQKGALLEVGPLSKSRPDRRQGVVLTPVDDILSALKKTKQWQNVEAWMRGEKPRDDVPQFVERDVEFVVEDGRAYFKGPFAKVSLEHDGKTYDLRVWGTANPGQSREADLDIATKRFAATAWIVAVVGVIA